MLKKNNDCRNAGYLVLKYPCLAAGYLDPVTKKV